MKLKTGIGLGVVIMVSGAVGIVLATVTLEVPDGLVESAWSSADLSASGEPSRQQLQAEPVVEEVGPFQPCPVELLKESDPELYEEVQRVIAQTETDMGSQDETRPSFWVGEGAAQEGVLFIFVQANSAYHLLVLVQGDDDMFKPALELAITDQASAIISLDEDALARAAARRAVEAEPGSAVLRATIPVEDLAAMAADVSEDSDPEVYDLLQHAISGSQGDRAAQPENENSLFQLLAVGVSHEGMLFNLVGTGTGYHLLVLGQGAEGVYDPAMIIAISDQVSEIILLDEDLLARSLTKLVGGTDAFPNDGEGPDGGGAPLEWQCFMGSGGSQIICVAFTDTHVKWIVLCRHGNNWSVCNAGSQKL